MVHFDLDNNTLIAVPFMRAQFFAAPIMAHLGVDAHMNTTSWNASVHGGADIMLISDQVCCVNFAVPLTI